MRFVVGSRITLPDGTSAVVKSVSGDYLGVIPDGENMIASVARADCTLAEIGQVVNKARAVVRRHNRADVQIAYREDRARRLDLSQALLGRVSQRGSSRESRPQGRRVRSSAASSGGGDPPQKPDDDPPPPSSDLERIRPWAELARALARRYGSDA